MTKACGTLQEHRDAVRSTVITSQLPRDDWHVFLGDPTVADAVLDRLVHNAYTMTLKGPSRCAEYAVRVWRCISP